MRGRDHTIRATVTIPDDGTANGVVIALGSVLGGFSMYILDGRLCYAHNLVGKDITTIRATDALAPGAHELRFEYVGSPEFSGTLQLFVDDISVARGPIAFFTPAQFSITGGGLTCGFEVGPAVSPDYVAPNRAAFTIHDVVVELFGEEHIDPIAQYVAIMSEQ